MRIYACYCIYNEVDTIEQSINSIIDYVDKIVVVDGPFLGFPAVSLKSDDGTLDILEQYKKKLIYIFVPKRMRAPEKRSLQFIEGADWYFQIDGDEVAVGDVEAGLSRLKTTPHKVAEIVVYLKDGSKASYSRLVKYQPGLHFYENHYILKSFEGHQIRLYGQREVITEFYLKHLRRSPLREHKHQLYRRFKLKHSRHNWEGS